MREQLIAALSVEFDLTAEEIADILWLALQQQSSQSWSSLSDVSPSENSKPPNPSPRSPSSEPTIEKRSTDLTVQNKPKAQIYTTTQSNRQRSRTTGTLSLAIPDAPSLREPLSLTRALRPLMGRVPSPKATQINETATAERTAAEGLCIPVLQPLKEPWLEIALVVDEGISMVIWRHTVNELKRLLEHYGAFRDVRTWALVNDEQQKTIFLRAGIGITTNNPRLHSPRELIDPAKRRLVLVVSDCVSALWRNGNLLPALQVWAENGPFAVVQMLPEWLWDRTALGLATSARFSGLTPGVANTALKMQVSSLWDDEDFEQGIKVPVLTLEPEIAATWSKMVSGQGNVWAPGFVFAPNPDLEEETAPQENSTSLFAEERVQGFRLNASPMARRLAGLLSAAPTICLPVVRIIQDAMLPASRQVHVAEVFLGGLLKPVSEIKPNTNPDAVQYDFIEGVRELLLNSTPQSDSLTVLNAVSEYVAERIGKNLYEFNALLKNPQQANNQDEQEQIQPFAEITAKVLKRLGGKYARFAEEIENFQQEKIKTPTIKQRETIGSSSRRKKTILFLQVNPKYLSLLPLDKEVKEIEEGLKRSKNRTQFNLERREAVTLKNMQRAILEINPQIIHFSGHGVGEEGLALEDENGQVKLLSSQELASFFKLFREQIECVVLNADYSEIQAQAIVKYIPYVIGMKKAIGDQAAIEFSVGFYDALWAGKSFEFAYNYGCASISIAGIPEELTPIIRRQHDLDFSTERETLETTTSRSLDSPEEVRKIETPAVKQRTTIGSSSRRKKTILFLAANPNSSTPLRLDEEVKEIEKGLKRSKKRAAFNLEQRWAVTPRDMQRAILEINPQIIHFSGHGAGEDGLVLEDKSGQVKLVTAEALASLFKLFREQIECVVFNACYSEVQAQAIAQYIPYVIGMEKAVGYKAAIEFAVGFYDALGARESFEFAYEYGCTSISRAGIAEELNPIIKRQCNLDASLELEPLETTTSLSLDSPEGSVSLDSSLYIERPPIESHCYETILKTGALIRIIAPRQMGRTSLMARILNTARQNQHQTAYVNFQEFNFDYFYSIDLFLQQFCANVANALYLDDKLTDFWKGSLGSKTKCSHYFQWYLLETISEPLTLGLDEVDLVFQYPEIAQDFFDLLRTWHERGKNESLWQRLNLVISLSKEVYIPLNINQSPLNIGLPIELPEFTVEQVTDLVKRHHLNWLNSEIETLMGMVGGHPYLVRKALYEIARSRLTLEEFIKISPTEEGLYSDHLRRLLFNLNKDDGELATAMKKVVASDKPVRLEGNLGFNLRSMGLVKFRGNGVIPLCNLYRLYFSDRLGV